MELLEILGYVAAIFTGFVLGALGSGGSILALPVLMYLFGIEPVEATSYSLFIVGATAVYGTIKNQRKSRVEWKVVLSFGAPMLIAVAVARSFFIPYLPDEILGFSSGQFITLLFAILMLFAAIAMWKGKKEKGGRRPMVVLILQGFLTGLLTGTVGAGGGFIIVPVLVLGLSLSVKNAVGTSLAIIAVNSMIGFGSDLLVGKISIDWQLILLFTLMSAAGLYLGSRIANKLPQAILKKAFAVMVSLIALSMIWASIP